MTNTTQTEVRPLHEIAAEIRKLWRKDGVPAVNFAAEPYLEAMSHLDKVTDMYFEDKGKHIVMYFLSNARSFSGLNAKRIKAELKSMIGQR